MEIHVHLQVFLLFQVIRETLSASTYIIYVYLGVKYTPKIDFCLKLRQEPYGY